ncbi:hypothetical protein PG993_003706 [Apiospora rasikravindrae]|uniref:HAD family hydrolase n=1 Tax=Apiospora rasikravindrae TaxID=990691 RepID=A0ABR1U094_9PEZI
MDGTGTPKAIVFDLDNTLFDHQHSSRCAISAVRNRCPELAGKTLDELITKYDAAFQKLYDAYLRKEITHAHMGVKRIQTFFTDLGLAASPEKVKEFRAIYKPAYREARRAAPGSIETLTKLREHGYSLAILTNGHVKKQNEKAELIGVRHLVHHLVTSEEVGFAKPDPRIFRHVLDRLGTSADATYMVGDSPNADIKGALDAGMRPILYSPMAQGPQRLIFEQQVPVIHHMSQLLEYFAIT